MSDLPERDPLSIPWIVAAKGREKIAMLTVYDAPSARLLDEAGIEVLLVGDSVEMCRVFPTTVRRRLRASPCGGWSRGGRELGQGGGGDWSLVVSPS